MFLTTKEVVIFCSKFCDRHIWVDEQLENKCCKRAICQTTLTAFIKFANTILIFFITLSYCHQQELYRVCTISNFSDTLESVTCSIHPQMMLMIGGKIRFHFFQCNFFWHSATLIIIGIKTCRLAHWPIHQETPLQSRYSECSLGVLSPIISTALRCCSTIIQYTKRQKDKLTKRRKDKE